MRWKPRQHAFLEHVLEFGVRNDIPTLLLEDLAEDRVAGRGAGAELAPFPVAEIHLAQVGFLDGFETDPRCKWSRGLMRALQRRHVDRVDTFVDETFSEKFRLTFAHRVERRVAVAVA